MIFTIELRFQSEQAALYIGSYEQPRVIKLHQIQILNCEGTDVVL
jgi:hypothetical protein